MTGDGTLAVSVNGSAREIRSGASLADLVAASGRSLLAVAVEVNGEIVPRRKLEETPVRAGDRVEIVQFVQGG